MHNIVTKDGITVEQEERRILDDLAYHLKAAERQAIRIEALKTAMIDGLLKSTFIQAYEKMLVEQLTEIAALSQHFCAPAPASVQIVSRETKENAA